MVLAVVEVETEVETGVETGVVTGVETGVETEVETGAETGEAVAAVALRTASACLSVPSTLNTGSLWRDCPLLLTGGYVYYRVQVTKPSFIRTRFLTRCILI